MAHMTYLRIELRLLGTRDTSQSICKTCIAQIISSGQNGTNTPTEPWRTGTLLDTHEEPKATFVSFWSLVYGLDM